MSASEQPGTLADAQAPETCASCAAPFGDDQRYCLHCGEPRAGRTRALPAALRAPAPEPAPEPGGEVAREAGDPRPGPAPQGPSIAAVLAGLACLLLAMGVGVLIGRDASEPAATQAPVTVAAAAATTAAPAPAATFTSDWPAGKDGWTVALSLLPVQTTTPDAVAQAKAAAIAKGAGDVGALDSAAYPSLTAGSYVVYSGVFERKAAAVAARAALVGAFPAARVVRVGAAASAAAAAAAAKRSASKPASGTTTTPSDSTESGSSDTSKEFEKSKKAPKTVGTGGKPPPKDNKPPAGGGDFEDIG